MEPISEQQMRAILNTARPYTVVILSKGPNYAAADARATVWEHGKRNMQLRVSGKLNVVIPLTDDGEIRGLGVFDLPIDEVKALLGDDPAIKAGVLTAEYRAALSFAGDSLK